MSYFIKKLLGTLLFFTFIFLGAGTIRYTPGWLYVSMGVLMLILEQTVFRIDPNLSRERASGIYGIINSVAGISASFRIMLEYGSGVAADYPSDHKDLSGRPNFKNRIKRLFRVQLTSKIQNYSRRLVNF